MNKTSALPLALAFAVCVTASVGLTSARADVYVIESTASSVAVSTHLKPEDAIAIPSGAYVRIVLPTGKTQTVRGPFNGKVGDLAQGGAQNEGMMVWLRNMLKTGNSTETTTGATRGVTREIGKTRTFSWAEVPSSIDGTVCVQKGGGVVLTRIAAVRSDRATLVDTASGERAEVIWDAGSQTAPWPASIKLKPDGAYQLFVQDRPRRQIVVRVIDKLPDEADVLSELHQRGCKHQFEAWVRERMSAGKS